MRLPLSTRLFLILFGLGVAAVGVVGLLTDWPLGTPVIVLVIGLLMVFAGALGAAPNLNFKEGILHWPDPKVYDRLDELEKALAVLRSDHKTLATRVDGEALALDFVYTKLPAPDDDEQFDDDAARLRYWEDSEMQIDHELSSMLYDGEDYNDGISVQGLQMMLEDLHRDMRLERRRLEAKERFRWRIYDGHHPGKKI